MSRQRRPQRSESVDPELYFGVPLLTRRQQENATQDAYDRLHDVDREVDPYRHSSARIDSGSRVPEVGPHPAGCSDLGGGS